MNLNSITEPRIERLKPKQLVGLHTEMSLSNNKTAELWHAFMRRRGEIKNRLSSDYISMQKYDENPAVSPNLIFEKWATVEVSSFADIPTGMDSYRLNGGKYAVFTHHGTADTAGKTMQYIFAEWLPESGYRLDNREHFEILPENYHPTDPEATEEIWIPVG